MSDLPEILWFQIFKYMTITDFAKVALLSRRLSEIASHYPEIYERECLRLFTTDLSLFENDVHALLPTEITVNQRWGKLLKLAAKLQHDWRNVKLGPVPTSHFTGLHSQIIAIMKDPPLPMPGLIRDEFNAYKRTILQNYLYELIFPKFDFTEDPCIVSIRDELQQAKVSSKGLFCIRWYHVKKNCCDFEAESISSVSTDYSEMDCSNFEPTAVFSQIMDTVRFYCKVCRACILRHKDPCLMISEYCKRWAGYSAAMIELETLLAPLAEALNKFYEGAYPSHPKHLQFTFIKAMTSHWKHSVYFKARENLSTALNELLVYERKQSQSEEYNSMIDLVAKYTHSVADLSIQELSVHYLGSSKLVLEGPYSDVEKIILKNTRMFYKAIAKCMRINEFRDKLESDYEEMENAVLPTTARKIAELKREYLEKYLRYRVKHKFERFSKKRETEKVQGWESTSLGRFVKEIAGKMAESFYADFVATEAKTAELYKEIFEQREEEEKLTDMEIDYMNEKRGIPFEISEEEKILYEGNVTVKVLDELAKKWGGDENETDSSSRKGTEEEMQPMILVND